MKNILIPYDLFYMLIKYHFLEDYSCEADIKKGLEKKVNALADHMTFTKSKMAATPEEREEARLEYLNSRNIPEEFRW